MLTVGYEGGMSYEEAKKHTEVKFYIEETPDLTNILKKKTYGLKEIFYPNS